MYFAGGGCYVNARNTVDDIEIYSLLYMFILHKVPLKVPRGQQPLAPHKKKSVCTRPSLRVVVPTRLQTPDHIVFRCGKFRRVKDERGRREWARENGMRWDSWDALASKKWVRMEDSGRVDDEGRPILERVELMEAFSTVRSRNHVFRSVSGVEAGACTYRILPRARP